MERLLETHPVLFGITLFVGMGGFAALFGWILAFFDDLGAQRQIDDLHNAGIINKYYQFKTRVKTSRTGCSKQS